MAMGEASKPGGRGLESPAVLVNITWASIILSGYTLAVYVNIYIYNYVYIYVHVYIYIYISLF